MRQTEAGLRQLAVVDRVALADIPHLDHTETRLQYESTVSIQSILRTRCPYSLILSG